MHKMSVYQQLTTSPADLFGVLKQEIGVKTSCFPFAVKAIDALKTLGNLTEREALNAANTFLDNLQTINQGGIIAEDYDKIDFVKRGKTITISARVEAFLRAAARKGYRIIESIVAVPEEDGNTTYFKEQFYNGEIIYVLEDRRIQGDRRITAERIVSGYFRKFICRLEVREIKSGKRVAMTVCEMSNDEILSVSKTSEQGIFKTYWEEYTNENGYKKKHKVVTNELNKGSFWYLWTDQMVNKTIIRRALKRVREVLPELKDTIYAFENELQEQETAAEFPTDNPINIEIPMETVKVDLNNLTSEQKADVKEMLGLFMANPKLAEDKANEIKAQLESGKDLQSVINSDYASIVNIKRSKKLYPIISQYFDSEQEDGNEQDKA